MSIKGNQVMPAGRPQPEVRANDGKNIKYEYGQLPEDEVFRERPLTHNVHENIDIIHSNYDYFRQKLNNVIENPIIGNAEAKSFGGRSLQLAYNTLMGGSDRINEEITKHSRKYPIRSTSLVQSHINSERKNSQINPNQRRNSYFQQNQDPYYIKNPYQEESYEQPYSFSEKLNARFGSNTQYEGEPDARLFNRSRNVNRLSKAASNSTVIPGKQFIKTSSNKNVNKSEQELIEKIREKRKQISPNANSQQGETVKKREVTGEKFNFEEI